MVDAHRLFLDAGPELVGRPPGVARALGASHSQQQLHQQQQQHQHQQQQQGTAAIGMGVGGEEYEEEEDEDEDEEEWYEESYYSYVDTDEQSGAGDPYEYGDDYEDDYEEDEEDEEEEEDNGEESEEAEGGGTGAARGGRLEEEPGMHGVRAGGDGGQQQVANGGMSSVGAGGTYRHSAAAGAVASAASAGVPFAPAAAAAAAATQQAACASAAAPGAAGPLPLPHGLPPLRPRALARAAGCAAARFAWGLMLLPWRLLLLLQLPGSAWGLHMPWGRPQPDRRSPGAGTGEAVSAGGEAQPAAEGAAAAAAVGAAGPGAGGVRSGRGARQRVQGRPQVRNPWRMAVALRTANGEVWTRYEPLEWRGGQLEEHGVHEEEQGNGEAPGAHGGLLPGLPGVAAAAAAAAQVASAGAARPMTSAPWNLPRAGTAAGQPEQPSGSGALAQGPIVAAAVQQSCAGSVGAGPRGGSVEGAATISVRPVAEAGGCGGSSSCVAGSGGDGGGGGSSSSTFRLGGGDRVQGRRRVAWPEHEPGPVGEQRDHQRREGLLSLPQRVQPRNSPLLNVNMNGGGPGEGHQGWDDTDGATDSASSVPELIHSPTGGRCGSGSSPLGRGAHGAAVGSWGRPPRWPVSSPGTSSEGQEVWEEDVWEEASGASEEEEGLELCVAGSSGGGGGDQLGGGCEGGQEADGAAPGVGDGVLEAGGSAVQASQRQGADAAAGSSSAAQESVCHAAAGGAAAAAAVAAAEEHGDATEEGDGAEADDEESSSDEGESEEEEEGEREAEEERMQGQGRPRSGSTHASPVARACAAAVGAELRQGAAAVPASNGSGSSSAGRSSAELLPLPPRLLAGDTAVPVDVGGGQGEEGIGSDPDALPDLVDDEEADGEWGWRRGSVAAVAAPAPRPLVESGAGGEESSDDSSDGSSGEEEEEEEESDLYDSSDGDEEEGEEGVGQGVGEEGSSEEEESEEYQTDSDSGRDEAGEEDVLPSLLGSESDGEVDGSGGGGAAGRDGNPAQGSGGRGAVGVGVGEEDAMPELMSDDSDGAWEARRGTPSGRRARPPPAAAAAAAPAPAEATSRRAASGAERGPGSAAGAAAATAAAATAAGAGAASGGGQGAGGAGSGSGGEWPSSGEDFLGALEAAIEALAAEEADAGSGSSGGGGGGARAGGGGGGGGGTSLSRLELDEAGEAIVNALLPALLQARGALDRLPGHAQASGTASAAAAAASGGASRNTASSAGSGSGGRTQIFSAVVQLPPEFASLLSDGSGSGMLTLPLGGGGASGGRQPNGEVGGASVTVSALAAPSLSWRRYVAADEEALRGRQHANDAPDLPGVYDRREIPPWAARFAPGGVAGAWGGASGPPSPSPASSSVRGQGQQGPGEWLLVCGAR